MIGPGIMANSAAADPEARAALDAAFIQWGGEADADGRTDWYGLQAEIARAMIVDGEALIQKLASPQGLRLRLIPSEQLDTSMTRELQGGGYVVQGVEFDASGQRVAYHILPARPTNVFASYAPPVRVPADDILHVFKPLGAGQVRGVSWLAAIILQASDFDALMDALLMGQKVAALMSAFVVDPNATGQVQIGDDTGDLSSASLEPGVIRTLPAGTDVRFTSPQQARDSAAFIRTQLQALAAGLGVPEHMVSGDLSNANYSSLRAGLLPFRARLEQTQYGVLVPQLLRPVWRAALELEALAGRVEADDLAVEWIMPRPMQVDPLKDTEATREALSMGLMSRRQAVAEQGWNVEALDAEIAADREREARLGLNFSQPQQAGGSNADND